MAREARVEYLIEPIPEADVEDRTIPHFTVRAHRGDYTGGLFLWALDESEARIVVRALGRDDERPACFKSKAGGGQNPGIVDPRSGLANSMQ
jgi:hypothetical protein